MRKPSCWVVLCLVLGVAGCRSPSEEEELVSVVEALEERVPEAARDLAAREAQRTRPERHAGPTEGDFALWEPEAPRDASAGGLSVAVTRTGPARYRARLTDRMGRTAEVDLRAAVTDRVELSGSVDVAALDLPRRDPSSGLHAGTPIRAEGAATVFLAGPGPYDPDALAAQGFCVHDMTFGLYRLVVNVAGRSVVLPLERLGPSPVK